MRIPPEKIDEIRNAIDIVDLIGRIVPLKKRGKSFIGLCPFHNEKTPSFNVSSERQMYHCFGCGVGGNAITFVMEYEKISFVEAIRSLAEKAGIILPTYSTIEDEARASEQDELFQICREAGLYFYKLMVETPEGKFCYDYFLSRGFSVDTIRAFGLGYSLNSWDAFINYATGKKYRLDLLEKAGLIRKREDGTYHDYFRGRAMFPIFSTTGRVIGFGARKLRKDDPLGKYLNSPETIIYNKSKILYGLFQAKDAIREKDFSILVEGYADLLSVFQSGNKNVVASSGTALTKEQIQLISRYTKNITIMYDSDSAGSKAALRGVDLILENDLDVRVAPLPEGDDPDSFIRKNGNEAFQKIIDEAISFVDFIVKSFEQDGKLKTPEGQAQTVRAIVQTISKMSDELKRNFYIRQVAEKYRLYESTLHRELEKILDIKRREYPSGSFEIQRETKVESSENSIQAIQEIPPVEYDLIHAILDGGPSVLQLVANEITLDYFSHQETKVLFELLLQMFEDGENLDPSVLVTKIGEENQRRLIAQVMFSKYQLSKGWSENNIDIAEADPKKIALDAVSVMKRRTIEKLLEDNQQKLRIASSKGEDVMPFMERHKQLTEELRKLGHKQEN